MTNSLQQLARHGFNWWVNRETRKAQQKYGFDMTKREYSYSNTHNNEADAFKHTLVIM